MKIKNIENTKNLKEIELQEMQNIELKILEYVDSICKKNGINYYLDSGTLLGAVRHKGFIPWDDDIDIIVFRKDYDLLLNLLSTNEGYYKLFTKENTDNYFYLFAKVVDTRTTIIEEGTRLIPGYGVFLDIFPIDYYPIEEKSRNMFLNKLNIYRKFIGYSVLSEEAYSALSFFRKFKYNLSKAYGWKRGLRKIENLCKKQMYVESDYAVNIVASSDPNRMVPTSVFEGFETLEFEGEQYPVPKKYDDYLKILYGNYMEIPSEENRVTNHKIRAYWKE